MAAMGPVAFAVLVWGIVGLVMLILAYELYVVARELGVG